jgi:hypothetical protein
MDNPPQLMQPTSARVVFWFIWLLFVILSLFFLLLTYFAIVHYISGTSGAHIFKRSLLILTTPIQIYILFLSMEIFINKANIISHKQAFAKSLAALTGFTLLNLGLSFLGCT